MASLLLFNGDTFQKVQCEELDDYYKYLECDCFDITTRKINGAYFDIFCDDIGLFREDPKLTAVSPKNKPMLVGNLIFANHDSEGNTTSLSDEDMVQIISSVKIVGDGNRIFPVVEVDY